MRRGRLPGIIAAALASCAAACSLAFGVGQGAVGGEPSPCGQPHRFCLDFDEGPLDGSPLHLFTVDGALALDDASARSLPNALLSTSSPLTGGSSPEFASACSAFVGDPPGDTTLAFEMRVDQSDTTSDTSVAGIGIGDACGPGSWLLLLALSHQGNWALSEYAPGSNGGHSTDHPTSFAFPTGWTKIALQVHFEPNMQPGSWASLTVDGQLVFDRQALSPSVATGTPQFTVGISSVYPPTNGWRVRFDNLTFDDGVVSSP